VQKTFIINTDFLKWLIKISFCFKESPQRSFSLNSFWCWTPIQKGSHVTSRYGIGFRFNFLRDFLETVGILLWEYWTLVIITIQELLVFTLNIFGVRFLGQYWKHVGDMSENYPCRSTGETFTRIYPMCFDHSIENLQSSLEAFWLVKIGRVPGENLLENSR
jgi:hypothetical protein